MKKVFITSLIFLILLVNLPYLLSFWQNFKGIQEFKKQNFSQALKYFSNSNIGIYNKANTFYKMGNYKKAISYYLSINTENIKEKYFILHNLGNSYYKLGEDFEKQNGQVSKFYRQQAVKYYKKALQIGKDKINKNELNKTKLNLEYVLNKLKNKIKGKKQENLNNKNTQNNNKNTTLQKLNGNNNLQILKQGTKNNTNNGKSVQKENNSNGKNGNKQNKQLIANPQQKQNGNNQQKKLMKYLQEYSKQLQNQQKQLMQYYGKVYKEQNQDPFDQFFNDDPFFQLLPKQQEKKKDW